MAAAGAVHPVLKVQQGPAFGARVPRSHRAGGPSSFAPTLSGRHESQIRGEAALIRHASSPAFLSFSLCSHDRFESALLRRHVGSTVSIKQGKERPGPVPRMAAGGSNPQNGKVIVVTGVSKGLGQSLAVELASRGHTLVGCARSEASVKDIAERLGEQHAFSVVDVASDKEVRSWADATIKRFGVPDIIVNNAGLINKNAPLWEVPVEEFDAVVDVNIKGPANVIRHFVPHMVSKQRGVIVNMSSGWGRSAAPDVAPYCTTKWGIEGMSRALARELPRGCIAVALNPGVINTDMLQSCFGPSASMYQTADTWSRDAADLILSINANDNGTSMTVT